MLLKAAASLLLLASPALAARTGHVTAGLLVNHEFLESECTAELFSDTGKLH